MEELCRYIPRIDDSDDDDDDGYDSPPATENWDEERNEYADFLDHKRMWAAVLTELGMIRPLARVEKEMSLARLDKESLACNTRHEQRPTKLIDRRGRSLPRLHFD